MKNYEELTFTDDFMFCKTLQENEDLCKELTELVLGRKIGRIVKTEKQKSVEMTADGHGVRFDVYFEDDDSTVYDIEMQRSDTKELPLRSRYYQGMIDLDYLEKGHKYQELPDSYIIFLCVFDLFQQGYHKYSFRAMCNEVPGLYLKDNANRVFICAGGEKDDVSNDMKSFIDYLVGCTPSSDLTERIEKKVKEAIALSLWRKEYMTYREHMEEQFNIGREEGYEAGMEIGLKEGKEAGLKEGKEAGLKDGKDQINMLNSILIEAGRIDDLKKATTDTAFQKKLIDELLPANMQ